MTVFEAVRENVTARMAAEALGLRVRWNGMACCPFHPDRHPSMKLDERYYCFGCHASGDAIDFTSNYLNVDKRDAAEKLTEMFGLSYEKSHHRHQPKGTNFVADTARRFNDWCKWALDVLERYERFNACVKERQAPEPGDEEWPDAFLCALMEQDTIAYLRDILENGTLQARIDLYDNDRERINEYEKRMERHPAGEDHGTASVSDKGSAEKG